MKRSLIAALLLCLTTPVVAADGSRKIDFTQPLLDQDSRPMTECVKLNAVDRSKCDDEKVVTLGYAVFHALNVPEQNVSYTEATKRGQLALNVYRAADVGLSSEEISLIKTQLPKRWSPLVVARAVEILDPIASK